MKAGLFALLLLACYVECKKSYAPLDKHANVDFINMEGGGIKPAPRPGAGQATLPPKPQPAPAPKPPQTPQQASVPKPVQTAQPAPTTFKPLPVVTKPPQPAVTPLQPKTPQIKPVPVNPSPVANPITTPGPGSVKDLVNFYNAQGKGSPIRPYSYSQAVKQG